MPWRKTVTKSVVIYAALVGILAGSFQFARAQTQPTSQNQQTTKPDADQQPGAESNEQELAKKVANPVSSLISVPFQSNFDFNMGTGSGWRYTLNFQPVIPVALNKDWNLISRTIVPIIHQGNLTGPNTSQNGLGD